MGSNGHRAARYLGAASECGLPDGLILPSSAVDRIITLAEDDAGTPLLIGSAGDVSVRACVVRCGTALLQFNLLDGTYPDMDRVMPRQHHATRCVAKREPLLQAYRSAQRMAPDTKGVDCATLTGLPADRAVRVSTVDESAETDVPVDELAGDIGFPCQPEYAIDALEVLTGDVVTLSHSVANIPTAYLTGSDPNAQYVIAGMRV